ncbi:hypothetical protein [Acetobacter thailandicus]|uniref:Uncharacterized protein n=1 Tax=Acetobacter thailandicus TaxID=1502842 RepID=A0ABT3QB89_9PROT|nr:hypothetical protein [Acetobacter thailandicus]MCX2562549.1 hypothetical protein [Acetobacter thailandicus]NHN94615.1 hypothetical protein [Acetobacter thailandicus]
MISPSRITIAALALSCAATFSAPAAHALSARECHQNFSDARKAGTAAGQSYKEFKAAHCDASAAEKTAPATPAAETSAAQTAAPADKAEKTTEKKEKHSAVTAATDSSAVFPTAIAPQYAKLPAGKARMKTCVDQYNANKADGHNGSLKWIQKGGGYYSLCNNRLKGE